MLKKQASLQIIDNFFTPEAFSEISDIISEVWANPESKYRSNITFWSPHIVQDSSVVLIFDVMHDTRAYQLIADTFAEKVQQKPSYLFFYFWTDGSYIPWHDDSHVTNTATIYCNEEWKDDWGGAYVYKEKSNEHSLYPVKNRCLFQAEHIAHSTTPTVNGAPIRRTIQAFFS